MAEAKWIVNLSVTDRLSVGLIQVRKSNKNSEIWEANISRNNLPYDLTDRSANFCTNPTGKSPVERPAEIIDAKRGKIRFIMTPDCLQQIGRNTAYFNIYSGTEFLDSTQDFIYDVTWTIDNQVFDGEVYNQRLEDFINHFAEIEAMFGEDAAYSLGVLVLDLQNNKADQTYVESKLIDIMIELSKLDSDKADKELTNLKLTSLENDKRSKSVLLTMSDLAQDVKDAITGNATANVGKKAITGINVRKNSIGVAETSFFVRGKNKIDKNCLVENTYVNTESGDLVSNGTYDSYQLLAVEPNTQYTATTVRAFTEHDSSGQYIKGKAETGNPKPYTFTTGQSTEYINISFSKDARNEFQLEKGAVQSEFEKPKATSDVLVTHTNNYEDGSVTLEKLTLTNGKNKVNGGTRKYGFFVNPDNGGLIENPNYQSVIGLPSEGNQVWSCTSLRSAAFRNAIGNVIPGGITEAGNPSPYTFTTPPDARFIDFCFSNTHESYFQLEIGPSLTAFQPPYVKVEGLSTPLSAVIDDTESNSDELVIHSDLYATVGKRLEVYNRNLLLDSTSKSIGMNSALGALTEKGYGTTASNIGDYKLAVSLKKNGKDYVSKDVMIHVRGKRANQVKVLLIADSLGRAYVAGPNIATNPDDFTVGNLTGGVLDVMGDKVKFVGSMGQGDNKYEARGGWTAGLYRTNMVYEPFPDKPETYENVFYNSVINDFDFATAINSGKVERPDVVIFNLGTNRPFNAKNDLDLLKAINAEIADLSFLIDSVRSFDSSIKIAVNITIPPTDNVARFTASYGGIFQTQPQYRYNNFEWIKAMKKNLKNVYFIDTHSSVDPEVDFADGVHLNLKGYREKMAYPIAGFLNWITV